MVRGPRWAALHSGWMSRLVLHVALAFGVLSPYRASPRVAESEEVETCGDSSESEATHARTAHRNARRGLGQGGPAHADLALLRTSVDARSGVRVLAHPRWQLPRRSNPPDEDPLA